MTANNWTTRIRNALAALVGAAGLFLLGYAAYLTRDAAAVVFFGEKTSGEVVDAVAVADEHGNGATRAPVIAYTDSSGQRFTFTPPGRSLRSCCELGERVTVYYDSRDHARAALANFTAFWAAPLLAASAGAFLLLISAIVASQPAPPGSSPRHDQAPQDAAPLSSESLLQFHPLNPVSYKLYLTQIAAPATAAKVKLTEAAAAMPQGRVPVVLAEFLAYMSALAVDPDALRHLSDRCPQVKQARLLKAPGARALVFLFEGTAFIVLAALPVRGAFGWFRHLTSLRSGPRRYVPPDTVWNAAPRHGGIARLWDAIRSEVEAWAKAEALQGVGARPCVFAGHAIGGAMAVLAAYEFKKRGRIVSGVVLFGAPHAGGDAFAAEYDQLGLDEHTLRIESGTYSPLAAQWPFLFSPVGAVWVFDKAPLAGRAPDKRSFDGQGLATFALDALGKDLLPGSPLKRPVWRSVLLYILAFSCHVRAAIAAFDIERRYALTLSALSYRRLRELLAAGNSDAELEAATEAFCDHLRYVSGRRPNERCGPLRYLDELPVVVSGTNDVAALTASHPDRVF